MADLMQTVLHVYGQHPVSVVLLTLLFTLLLALLLVWLVGVVWWMVKKWPLRYAVWWPVLVWADKRSGGTHGDD